MIIRLFTLQVCMRCLAIRMARKRVLSFTLFFYFANMRIIYAMIFFTTWRTFNSYALCSICYYASFLIFVVHSSLHTAYNNTDQLFTRINSVDVIEKKL